MHFLADSKKRKKLCVFQEQITLYVDMEGLASHSKLTEDARITLHMGNFLVDLESGMGYARNASVIVNFQPSNTDKELQKIENSRLFPAIHTALPIT